jgi:arylamine N-acetyltransferase
LETPVKCAPHDPSAADAVDPALLNPFLHTAGVASFLRHFSVTPKPADIHYLREILSYFSQFPYENLSKIIKHSVETETFRKLRFPLEVMDGYIRDRLGGTCFSLTFFLETILIHAGYRCHPVMGDMRWSLNSHCAMIVILEDGRYLIDPGYLLNQPMRMDAVKPRVYDSEFSGVELAYRPESDSYEVFTFNKTEMKWRYRFRDRPCPPGEFLRYWVSSFSWNSMHGLCLTRTERGKLIYVHKHFMRESTYAEKRNFNIKSDYPLRIHQAFGIEPFLVEHALAALDANMAKERELGLWKPRDRGRKTDVRDQRLDVIDQKSKIKNQNRRSLIENRK